MAIIKCPECGHDVSDKAKTCPHCGVDIAGNVIHCPRCNKLFLAEQGSCPVCGSVVRKTKPAPVEENTNNTKKASANNKRNAGGVWVWVSAFLIALVLVCVSLYYYWENKNAAETEAYYNAMESKSPAILQDYLDRFDSNDAHRDSVLLLLSNFAKADSAWCVACETATRAAFADFVESYPESEYVVEAKLRIDTLDWNAAKKKNDAEAYKFYIDNNPNGIYLDEATSLFEKLDSKIINKSDSLMIIKLFDDYYKALSDKDADKIKQLFAQPIESFLAKPNARVSDVVAYMERLHAPKDVKAISFDLAGDWTIVKISSGKGRPKYEVGFTVDYKINRTNVNKKAFHSYKVSAKISPSGRISSLDMSLAGI